MPSTEESKRHRVAGTLALVFTVASASAKAADNHAASIPTSTQTQKQTETVPHAAPPAAATTAPTVTAAKPSNRVPAYVLSGIGVVAVGVATGFSIAGNNTYDDARRACNGGTTDCPPAAVDLRNDAATLTNVANVVGAAGVLSLTAGVVWFFMAYVSDQPTLPPGLSVNVMPPVFERAGGVLVQGRF